MFQNVLSLTSVSLISEKNAEITSMQSTFEGCENLDFFNITGFNTANVKTISRIFYGCYSLDKIYIELNSISQYIAPLDDKGVTL